MNYFPFHIGDYAAATKHLTWDEDMAYRRLLDWYYTNEKPLPLDKTKVRRLVMANTPERIAAVDVVLDEFFIETPDGWTQKRIEDELAEMHMKQEAQEEREEGKQTRLQRFRQKRAETFQALQAIGVVPAWNAKMPELRALVEQNQHLLAQEQGSIKAHETPKNVSLPLNGETAPETAPETTLNATATALPIPITNNQEPIKEIGATSPRTPRPKKEETTLATYLVTCRDAGKKPLPADHPVRSYCRDAGISDEMLQVAWCVFRDDYTTGTSKGKRYKDWPGHFANAVRGCWAKLWYTDAAAGCVAWTSRGLQEKAVLDARARAKETEAA